MAPHSSFGLLPQEDGCGEHTPFKVQQIGRRSGNAESCASLLISEMRSAPRQLSREQSIREAVILVFCDPLADGCFLLQHLSAKEWGRLLDWLDISGLALYFLERMMELRLCHLLPPDVVDRLQQSLIDNSRRTSGMIAESVDIQRAFQEARLSYAVLKGFSLSPSSVPRMELRHQFDLDFLIAEKSALAARQILEHRGYRLYAISGGTWEFKINETPGVSLKDIYKDLPGRSVELHVESYGAGELSMLERTETRDFHGISMPVLSSVDQFLGQGLHVYKDICSEFSRAAHLLEFRRHVLARYDDMGFWEELRSAAQANPRASLGLGVATQLIAHVMGDFAPEEFMGWTVRRLPSSVLSWIEMYGHRVVFKTFPGNKLYLLLQKELEFAGIPAKRSLGRVLLPFRIPPPVVRASANEKLSLRLRRYRLQLTQILSRSRFHVVEGIRYAWESRRWQHMNRGV